MSDCSCDCPCVSPRCLWRFPGSLLRTGRLLVVCSIWACLVSHPPLPPQCPELSRLNPPAQPGELLSRALHVPGRCYGTAMPPRALAAPLLWGPEIPWEEGKWDGALASPRCPGEAGSVPQVCPQLLCHGRHTSLHPNNYLSPGASSSLASPGSGTAHLVTLWDSRGQAAPLSPASSSTTGKPNTWDILVVCCEIVS